MPVGAQLSNRASTSSKQTKTADTTAAAKNPKNPIILQRDSSLGASLANNV